jgi:predicted Rossmann-fold nucleotide-binding protein
MSLEIADRDALIAHIQRHGHLRNVVVQELDLREDGPLLRSISAEQAAFLGCSLDPDTVVHLYRTGADLFPPLTAELPFRPYRHGLYTVEELYEGFDPAIPGSFWERALDSRIYSYYDELRHRQEPLPIMETLAMRLHDHAVEDALEDLLFHGPAGPRKVVAIMGGHAMLRDQPIYREVAHMARDLARAGFFVATGGGPGAMEAGNLGAYLAAHDDAALDEAITLLTGDVDYASHHYLELAVSVRERWPRAEGAGESLAVPTWFYGHEPSNMFASHIAKYFANSVREDGLLAIAGHGVIYAPGSAGTVQEVFMDACQNHYGTFPLISPMVMLGIEHWTERLPVWPLLQAMSAKRPWGGLIGLCDRGDEALRFILDHPPVPSKPPGPSKPPVPSTPPGH